MTQLAKIIADFQTQLATEIAVGGTTATLQSNVDDDGATIPNGKYDFTVDGSNSTKEHFTCTVTGTSITDLKSVSRQGVETTGAVRKHRIGAIVTITDFKHIKAINDLLDGTTSFDSAVKLGYDADPAITSTDETKFATVKFVNETAIAGGVDATATVKGISKLSVAPVSATSPIAVGDNDPRVPTQGENDALVGTSGTPSTSNKYVTDADTTGTGSILRDSNIVGDTFGNGADGAMTADGSTTYNSFSSLSANVYTLTRDTFLTNLTGSTGVSINTGGYQLYINGTLTQNGTFKITANGNNGGNASGATAGTAGAAVIGVTVPSSVAGSAGGAGGASINGGGAGASGAVGTAGVAGTVSGANALGSAGATGSGTGGSSGVGAPSAGSSLSGGAIGGPGAITSTPVTYPVTTPVIRNVGYYRSGSFVPFNISGSNGGGGGGASGGASASSTSGAGGGGGGSGSNGGFIVVYAKTVVVNSGVILLQAKGGNGGNGANAGTGTNIAWNGSGGGGGGLGGNGGVIIFLYKTKSAAITYDVTGGSNGTNGTGSAGNGGGSAGSAGSTSGTSVSGVTYEINTI